MDTRDPLSGPPGSALNDLLDRLVGEYSDRVAAGEQPHHAPFLDRVPAAARPGLERCLKVVDAGQTARTSFAIGPGTRLGRFEIQREIGRGGMALVFLAQDPELRRPVALKVLRAGLALDQAHVDRFQREGRAIAQLSHPGVVQVYEVGSTGGLHWIAMEYVAGPSLATVIEAVHTEGAPSAERLGRAVGDLSLIDLPGIDVAAAKLLELPLAGLAAAHQAGIVHRDIKPSNILVHADGRAVLADFGLARSESDPGLSLTGEPVGTPHYMAPEQAHAAVDRIDERTDVYGFGVTLYELVSGSRPFEGDTVLAILDAIRFERPRPLQTVAPWASRDAAAVVHRATRRESNLRYDSIEGLASDVGRLARGEPTDAESVVGGPWRQFWSEIGEVFTGRREEYRSRRTFLGLPLVHVVGSPRPSTMRGRRGRRRVAKGWVAVGPMAVGGFAMGGLSMGALSFAGMGLGVLALGGMTGGGVAVGGCSVAVRAFGGLAVGDVACGGMAVGRGAIGGFACGKYVVGARESVGTHRWIVGRPAEQDRVALDFFMGQPYVFRSIYGAVIETGGPRYTGFDVPAK